MRSVQDKISVGVDIGTHKIAISVGQVREGLINIAALASSPSAGLRRGQIIDPEEVVSSLSAAIEDAQRISGQEITNAIVGYGGVGISTTSSRGVVAISRPDGEINEEDMERVMEAAKSVALPPNLDIIHLFPTNYTIDSQENTKDPRGLRGVRLEIDALTIGAPAANIRNLTNVANQAGIDINAIAYNPIAAARAILTKKQKENGVLLIDIGAATTSMVVYEEGDIIDAFVIPIGSSHITNDIAIGLKTTLEVAEKIKCHHLNADPDKVKETDRLDLSKITEHEDEKVSKKFITEIVDARLKEIFTHVRKELKRIKRDSLLPAGAVLTGGGSKLPGIISQAKDNLHLPVQPGMPIIEIGATIDKLDDPSYATSIGLSLMGLEMDNAPDNSRVARFDIKNIKLGGVVNRAKSIFKQLLP